MNEVSYLGEDLDLVTEFNNLKDKKSVSWSDEKYTHIRKTIKDHYLKEQNYTCFFCRQRIIVTSNRAWDAEHVISKLTHPDFMFEPKNICIACPDCNNEKRDNQVLKRDNIIKFPRSSNAYKTVHPHFDNYIDHLKVIVEGKLYQWKTTKGRYTYRIYGLDRFMKDSGRSGKTDIDSRMQNLMKAALTDTSDYEMHEKTLLEELLLKYSEKLGSKTTLSAIQNLRK